MKKTPESLIKEVYKMAEAGNTTAEISFELGLSQHTVRNIKKRDLLIQTDIEQKRRDINVERSFSEMQIGDFVSAPRDWNNIAQFLKRVRILNENFFCEPFWRRWVIVFEEKYVSITRVS